MEDNRMFIGSQASDVLQSFLAPILVGLIMGGGGAWSAIKYTEGVTSEKFIGVERRLDTVDKEFAALSIILQAVQTNQIELAAQGSWMKNIDKIVTRLDVQVTNIQNTRYSSEQTQKDYEAILREIKLRHKD